jgi:hypothetical protein
MDKHLAKRLFRHSYVCSAMQYVNLLCVSMQCVECRGGRIANKFTNRKSTNCGKKSRNLRFEDRIFLCYLRIWDLWAYIFCGLKTSANQQIHNFFSSKIWTYR